MVLPLKGIYAQICSGSSGGSGELGKNARNTIDSIDGRNPTRVHLLCAGREMVIVGGKEGGFRGPRRKKRDLDKFRIDTGVKANVVVHLQGLFEGSSGGGLVGDRIFKGKRAALTLVSRLLKEES